MPNHKEVSTTNPRSNEEKLTFFASGRRVRLGLGELQVGDIICILYGGAPSFVLRYPSSRSEDHHDANVEVAYLIGDALSTG